MYYKIVSYMEIKDFYSFRVCINFVSEIKKIPHPSR